MTTWITPQIDRLDLSAALMMNVGKCECGCGANNGAGAGSG
jgi:hypothetical protein